MKLLFVPSSKTLDKQSSHRFVTSLIVFITTAVGIFALIDTIYLRKYILPPGPESLEGILKGERMWTAEDSLVTIFIVSVSVVFTYLVCVLVYRILLRIWKNI